MANLADCCRTAFHWDGTPEGKEGKLADNQAYITGSNTDRAILICNDALGWRLNNTRLLADHYAREVGATVYLPDFFDDWPVDEKKISIKVDDAGHAKMEQDQDFDWAGWFTKNGPDVRLPEVLKCAHALREKYSKVGVVGFCWGGSVVFKLANKSNSGLFDVATICHPGTPTEDDVRNIGLPVQIIAPEHDPTFPVEWREFCNKEIPKLGVDYVFQYFPSALHGFTTKCDPTKEREKKALELAKNAVVFWMLTHL